MKNVCLLPILFLLSFTKIYSQQVVKGQVVDDITKSPLPNASVAVFGTNIGTVSDLEGYFKLTKIPLGRQTLKITFVGYDEVIIPNIIVSAGKEVVLNVSMKESFNLMENVVVTANRKDDKTLTNNEMAAVSARSFNIEDTKRYAGSLGDPSRMAANFAGVAAANDSRNDIVVRGNSPTGVLWQMESMNIPSPNHFGATGTTGGPVSMLNNNVLDKSDFMTGAFPAQYGNATSGVFDLKMRSGNNEKREYMAQIGFNGFEAGLEGPFSKNSKATYLLNYRHSTLGVFSALGIQFGTGTSIPFYQDLNFKLDFPISNKGKLSFFGILGKSHVDFLGTDVDTTKADPNFYSNENQNTKVKYEAGIIGAVLEYRYTPTIFSKFSVGVSRNTDHADIDSIAVFSRKVFPSLAADFKQSKVMLNYSITKKFSAKTNWNSGFSIDFLSYNLYRKQIYNEGKFEQVQLNEDGNTLLSQAFTQMRHYFNDRLSVRLGLHWQMLSLNNHSSFEPRASMTYSLNNSQTLSLGYGLHSQIQPITTYFTKTYIGDKIYQTNKDIDFTKSHQFVLTYDNNLTENLRLKIETYYQNLYNVPVEQHMSSFSMLNQGISFASVMNDSLVNKGTGTNYGVEFTLERFFDKGFYFLWTSSLFDSKYKGSDGIERNTAFNGKYVMNLLGGKEWKLKKNSTLGFAVKYSTQGGRYFTPINFAASKVAGAAVYVENQAFSEQQKAYNRFDLKFTFSMNKKHITQEFSLDLQNVLGTKNVFRQDYDPRTNRIVTELQQGFFPVPTYRLLF